MIRFIGFYDYTVILTYCSLLFSVLGMHQAFSGSPGMAVNCLLLAGVCDAFDGTIARTKKNRTDDEKSFGIQLDSLCDVVSFGIFPAYLCYALGMHSAFSITVIFFYCLCTVIRLAFFNVLETNRQKVETGAGKTYRGLPVTSISIVFPLIYILHNFVSANNFAIVLHFLLFIMAFLYILDFSVRKPDFSKILVRTK